MGVYIKGMEKPKSCDQCPISLWALPKDCYLEVEACPLVEVKTPHGRLIDANKLHEDIQIGIETEAYDKPFDYIAEILDAKTVIEAEVE